jgi:predicted DNA-binding transcriptional regulator YafY
MMLVSELKQNNYPNTVSFAEKLKKMDIWENQNVSCTPKTIARDIKTLKEEFDAPIEFDTANRGYYLTNHGWSFECPIFEESDMVAAVLGAKLAEEIFPSPLSDEAKNATDNLLAENNPDMLDTAVIDALVVASGLRVAINPEVFKTVFDAWVRHEAVEILYRSAAGDPTERVVEPQVLAYKNSSWFIKAYCHLRREWRTFAVHRIQSARLTGKNFEPDLALIRKVREDGIFDYRRVRDIVIECDAETAHYVVEKPLHSGQRVERTESGAALLRIPSAVGWEVVSWTLAQGGRARILKPDKLRKKVAEIAERIAKEH